MSIWDMLNPKNVAGKVNDFLWGGVPKAPDITDIRAQEWENYLNILNSIIQGRYPEQIQALEQTIQKQAQASGSNLLNRAMARMAAQGTLKSGLSNQVARDVAAMTASNTANLINQLHGQLLSSALSQLPSAIQAERSTAAKQYGLNLSDYQARQAVFNNLMQGLGGILQSSAQVSPELLKILGLVGG